MNPSNCHKFRLLTLGRYRGRTNRWAQLSLGLLIVLSLLIAPLAPLAAVSTTQGATVAAFADPSAGLFARAAELIAGTQTTGIGLYNNLFAGQPAAAQGNPFLTTWQTTAANESVTIPTTGAGYNDSIGDLVEGGSSAVDADNNGVADGPDRDGDGIVDSADGSNGGGANTFGDANSPVLPNSDSDNLPNLRALDSDGDGQFDIIDVDHRVLDANHDGKVDNVIDGDNDGIPDIVDTQDTLFGGLPNPWLDTDHDGVPDVKEGSSTLDTDGDGKPNYDDPDDDGDIIPTSAEDLNGNGNWLDADNDGDGIPAYLDPNDQQSGVGDADGDGVPDYLDADTDGSRRVADGIFLLLIYTQ